MSFVVAGVTDVCSINVLYHFGCLVFIGLTKTLVNLECKNSYSEFIRVGGYLFFLIKYLSWFSFMVRFVSHWIFHPIRMNL